MWEGKLFGEKPDYESVKKMSTASHYMSWACYEFHFLQFQ